MKLPFRFSLRTLVIVLTLICFVIGTPIGYIRYKAERQRKAIARLKELNVAVGLQADAKSTWVTSQLRRWVDKDAFRRATSVNIRANARDIDEVIALLPSLDELMELNCNKQSLNDHQLQEIASIRSLRHLGAEQSNCSPQVVRKLLENPNWELLALPKVKFNDELLVELGRQTKLQRLTFDASEVSADGLEHLASCRSLLEVFLYRVQHAAGFARAIRRLPKVKMAILLESTIGADDLAEFGDIGTLKSLQFYDCQIDSSKIDRIAKATQLSHLEFFRSPVSTDAVAAVGRLSKLQILSLDSCVDDHNVRELASLPALKYLALTKTELTDEGLQHAARVRTLTLVVLPVDTKCTEAGIRRLQEKAAIRVVIGETMSDGMLYLPGGLTEDRRKPKMP